MNPVVPIGLNFPLTRGPFGYFDATFNSLQNSRVQLEMLLKTRRGERPMRPNYGSYLYQLLFESNDGTFLMNVIEDTIRQNVAHNLPNILINSVLIDMGISNSDNYRATVTLSYSLRGIDNFSDIFKFDINK